MAIGDLCCSQHRFAETTTRTHWTMTSHYRVCLCVRAHVRACVCVCATEIVLGVCIANSSVIVAIPLPRVTSHFYHEQTVIRAMCNAALSACTYTFKRTRFKMLCLCKKLSFEGTSAPSGYIKILRHPSGPNDVIT